MQDIFQYLEAYVILSCFGLELLFLCFIEEVNFINIRDCEICNFFVSHGQHFALSLAIFLLVNESDWELIPFNLLELSFMDQDLDILTRTFKMVALMDCRILSLDNL